MAQTVHALHPFSDEDALTWLRSQGEIETSAAALGRRFGWPRQKASRRLQAWADTRQIRRRGRTIVALVPETRSLTVQEPGTNPETIPPDVRSSAHRGVTRYLLAGLLFLLGVSVALILVAVNVTSWAKFGRGAQEWYIVYGFVSLGATVAVAVMILPAVARVVDRGTATTLWVLWTFLFAVDVLVSIGFAYGNFGSAVAGTAAQSTQRAFEDQRIHSLVREKQDMGQFPHTTREAAEAATRARERACAAGSFCKAAEANEKAILKDRGLTIRSEEIAAEIRAAEEKRDGIQVVASADPLTDGVIDLVYQTTGAKWESRAVTTGRNVIFALLLLVPAGFFRGAASLARR